MTHDQVGISFVMPVTITLIALSLSCVVFQVFPRRIYHRFMVIIIHLHELVVDSSQSKTTFSLQGQVQIAIFLKQ